MRILVCGGRDYNDYGKVQRSLEPFISEDTLIIQGGARGADALGKKWAIENDIAFLEFPADWNKHGKAAGHIRNQQMLDEGKPDLVIAFEGGRGTANMIQRSKKAGVEVVEVLKDDL